MFKIAQVLFLPTSFASLPMLTKAYFIVKNKRQKFSLVGFKLYTGFPRYLLVYASDQLRISNTKTNIPRMI
jgi:hypothetical protein